MSNAVWALIVLGVIGVLVAGVEVSGGPSAVDAVKAGWHEVSEGLQWLDRKLSEAEATV